MIIMNVGTLSYIYNKQLEHRLKHLQFTCVVNSIHNFYKCD